MHADDIGWSSLTPSTETAGGSLLRRFARYIPMNFSGVAADKSDPAAKRFFGMVVEATGSTRNASAIACKLEKLLRNDTEADT